MNKSLCFLFALVWVTKSFMTIGDLQAFVRTLPEERAKEAKVFVINSQRSFLGVWSEPYFLMYREEN